MTSFDPGRGMGTVSEDGAGDVFEFHATAIADGSRTVETGSTVFFSVAPGHRGRYEARSLVRTEAQRPPGDAQPE